jgi:long-chain acyl-CoA synthetase
MNSYNFKTYNELFDYIVKNYSNELFLNYIENNKYKHISVKEFEQKVICLAIALKKIGIKKGDTVGIFSKPSPFWLIFDFAIHKVGAISVPIFDNISKKNLNFEIKDAQIKYLFIDSINRLDDIDKKLIFITHGFCIKEENYYNVDEIFHAQNTSCDFDLLKHNIPNEDDIFSIIYTSGNTGTPKGVVLTHKNIISQLHSINHFLKLDSKEVILSLLPLAHIFERMVMSFYVSHGVSIYFVDEITNTANLLKVVKPTMMTAVPRLLEKIFYKIKLNIEEKPFISKLIGNLAFNYTLKKDIDKNSILYKLYDLLVYKKLREIFGGRLDKLVSGGASLNEEICRFLININIPTYQGYGLTESSPVICTNYPGMNKIGSSGKVIPNMEVKIEDNELLARGDSIMKGYLNDSLLTSKTIDKDGWLHTGDIATIDKEGFIFIKSRKKDLFKLSTGNYVNAIKIEQQLSKNKYIEFANVIANNKKYVTALLFVNKELYENNKNNETLNEFYNNDIIHNSIKKDIKKINDTLNEWEKVVYYKLITNDISIEGGELTPSMKISRNVIEEKYKDIIETMY